MTPGSLDGVGARRSLDSCEYGVRKGFLEEVALSQAPQRVSSAPPRGACPSGETNKDRGPEAGRGVACGEEARGSGSGASWAEMRRRTWLPSELLRRGRGCPVGERKLPALEGCRQDWAPACQRPQSSLH